MYSYFTNKSQYMTVCYRKKRCIQDILRIGVASWLLVLKWVAIFERLGTTALEEGGAPLTQDFFSLRIIWNVLDKMSFKSEKKMSTKFFKKKSLEKPTFFGKVSKSIFFLEIYHNFQSNNFKKKNGKKSVHF